MGNPSQRPGVVAVFIGKGLTVIAPDVIPKESPDRRICIFDVTGFNQLRQDDVAEVLGELVIVMPTDRPGLNCNLFRQIQRGLGRYSAVADQPVQKLFRETSYFATVLVEPLVSGTAPLRLCIGVDAARQDAVAPAITKADLGVFSFG